MQEGITGLITWLYYEAMEPAAAFYEGVLGLQAEVDQGWAKIYAVVGGGKIGLVAGEKGFYRPQPVSAVLVSLVVTDAAAWAARLEAAGVPFLRPLEDRPEIGIRTFFVQDPGGYAVEVQEFVEAHL